MDFSKTNGNELFVFKIPFSMYKKNPIIDVQYENGSSWTWETLIRPQEIQKDWTIIFEINELPSMDLYCLIK